MSCYYHFGKIRNWKELLTTYWEIGRTIPEQKEKAGWGKKIIGKLANDLSAKFPELMPKQLKAEMPTIEEPEQELGRDIESMIHPNEEKNNREAHA